MYITSIKLQVLVRPVSHDFSENYTNQIYQMLLKYKHDRGVFLLHIIHKPWKSEETESLT